ncbi:hypothetical protein D1007_44366 [Hordeum vulgare]|nr:hypothetical protein D1007_44366 [Hordeum vulgare]
MEGRGCGRGQQLSFPPALVFFPFHPLEGEHTTQPDLRSFARHAHNARRRRSIGEPPSCHSCRHRARASIAPEKTSCPPIGSKGAWDDIDVVEDFIEHLRHRRKMSLSKLVEARVPGAELAPASRDGEVVVFDEHFSRGFGMPASVFFRRFLTDFGLQPHHLGPNSIL